MTKNEVASCLSHDGASELSLGLDEDIGITAGLPLIYDADVA